ncbi:MAG: hypothetical protein IJF37_08410 [Lachnospiraceae bacterium]|nr:hypothetical protein [Lachnospiraceae bacterium]
MRQLELFKATLYRMYKSTGVRIAVLLTYIAAICYYVLATMVANGKMGVDVAGSITGLGDAMIIWLFGSLIVGILVGGDFESKTIHGTIGHGRKNVVINYVMVYMVMMAVLLLPYLVGSVALIIAEVDMTGAESTAVSIFLDNVLKFGDGASIGKLVISYISYVIVVMGQLGILIIVAMKIRKAMAVTCVGFIFGMFTALIASLASKVEMLDNIYKLTPYNYGISRLGIEANISDMCVGIVVSLIFMAVCGGIGWIVFRKADIK